MTTPSGRRVTCAHSDVAARAAWSYRPDIVRSRRALSPMSALRSASRLAIRHASRTSRYFATAASPAGGRAVEDLLADALALRQAGGEQLLQRVADDVRVLDVQDEADVADLLVARAVADVVQHQHVGDRQLGAAGRRHAAHRPARERVPGDDQAELELRELDALGRDEVRRGDDAAPPSPCAAPTRAGSGATFVDIGRSLETLKTY